MDIQRCIKDVFRGALHSVRGFYVLLRLDNELDKRRSSRFSPSYSHSPVRRRPSSNQPTDSREQTPVQNLHKKEETTVKSRILQCSLLNGVIFLSSIIFFEYGFIPGIELILTLIFGTTSVKGMEVWYWIEITVRILFQSFWVVPLFVLTKFINNLWFQDIGHSAYRYSRGRSNTSVSLSKSVADFIFSTFVELLFLCQAILMVCLPIHPLGYVLYVLHLSLLYSLYAFEYKWGEMGWDISKRLTCIETNWPYFLGFGLPLVLCTLVSNSSVISGCIFSILFPFVIISANEANPGPECGSRIQVFKPVIVVSNFLFSIVGQFQAKNIAQPTVRASRR